jgi:protein O-GlcNAc transferase
MHINEATQLALKYLQTGDLQNAENVLSEIVQKQPDNISILNLLGLLYYQLQKYDSAIDIMKKLIGLDQNNFQAHFIIAHSLQEKGQLDEAVIYYQEALKLNPDIADVHYNLGTIYQERKQLDKAVECYQKALQINPSDAVIYYNLANTFQENKQTDEAITCYKKALQFSPDLFDAHYNLGILFKDKGELDDAISNFQKALQLNPNLAQAYAHLGLALQDKGEPDGAIHAFHKALELNPNNVFAYYGIGVALGDKGNLEESANVYRKALELVPDNVLAYCNLGGILLDQGKLHDAEICFKRASEAKPDDLKPYQAMLLMMHYNPKNSPEAIYSEHLQFAKKFEEPLASTIIPYAKRCNNNRPLKIGYVSPDFRTHAVGFFIDPVLTFHNHEHFEIYCYYNFLIDDEMTEHMRRYTDKWKNITDMSDEEVAGLIEKDKIDILIDLTGHAPRNRILVFARKPAPVQATWIGYPDTTGLSAIDYKLVDKYTDPPGMTEHLYTEKLMRLPDCFLCYLPYKSSPEVGILPAQRSGHITFGSFNYFSKVSPEVLKLWIEILKIIPDAHLIMKAKGFIDEVMCKNIMDTFNSEGIEVDRIALLPFKQSIRDHLEIYNSVDIGLDTFPYNGTTTTCEALWMGVPVITLAGITHVARVGTSLLSNIGLHELIAKNHEEYVKIAVNLANDITKLRSLRGNLRTMMIHSPLTDAKRFTLNLEKCYRKMWETWCRSD